jgi:hypothetical protein
MLNDKIFSGLPANQADWRAPNPTLSGMCRMTRSRR